ncbi:MAG: hypothetical protein PSW75_09685 [bacterium]|nr:hypothetical protein [bacterium]
MKTPFADYTLDYQTATDPALQAAIAARDARLRAKHGMTEEQTAVGVLDLATLRLALVRPDQIYYGASVPKIGILLAWFQLHPEAATSPDPTTRHELGLMIKVSDNEMAAKFSQQLGLKSIQQVIDSHGLYDAAHGGGLWVGKHYGKGTERYVDPVGGHSHAADRAAAAPVLPAARAGPPRVKGGLGGDARDFRLARHRARRGQVCEGPRRARRGTAAQGRLVGGLVPRHGRGHGRRAALCDRRAHPSRQRRCLLGGVRRRGGRPADCEKISAYFSCSQLVSGSW